MYKVNDKVKFIGCDCGYNPCIPPGATGTIFEIVMSDERPYKVEWIDRNGFREHCSFKAEWIELLKPAKPPVYGIVRFLEGIEHKK